MSEELKDMNIDLKKIQEEYGGLKNFIQHELEEVDMSHFIEKAEERIDAER